MSLSDNFKLLVQYSAATCNVCQTDSHIACHSETEFSICYDGEPSYNLLQCPEGSYCTDDFYTCYKDAIAVCSQTTTEKPTTTEGPWNAVTECEKQTKTIFLENKDDPTCTSYITCKVSGDIYDTKITTCNPNLYFNPSLKLCTATKPDGCVELTTEPPTTTTIVPTTTPIPTTTAKPWSAAETCLSVTQSTLFANEDDPTCISYLYCYVSKGSAQALIKNCRTDNYFDVDTKLCSATKPSYCT
ncbi:hypothetical protein KR009_003828 [Drosophila setifemur]|nr:hypothetical protein KR009_003828 [Drosophila setifemur]